MKKKLKMKNLNLKKMEVKLLTTIIMIVISLSSCKTTNNENERRIIKTYKGDSLWIEAEYIKNGKVKDGNYYIYYLEDSSVKKHIHYKNNKKHGKEKFYYKSGKLKYVKNFRNGILHDTTKYFYENGNLYYRCSYFEGVKRMDAVFYHENGEIHEYLFYDDGGVLRYKKTYNKEGNEMFTEGNGIASTYFSNDTLILGDSLKLEFITVRPPDYNATMKVVDEMMNQCVPEKEISEEGYGDFIFYLKFTEIGIKKVIYRLELRLDTIQEEYQDTLYIYCI